MKPAKEQNFIPSVEVLKPYFVRHDGIITMEFNLQGLKCGQCAHKVESLLGAMEGVIDYRSSLDGRRIKIDTHSPQLFPLFISGVHKLGFKAVPVIASDDTEDDERAFKRQLKELAVAGVCAGNTMLFSIAMYLGAESNYKKFFLKLSLMLSVPVLLYSSRSIFLGMWNGLRARSFNLDIPIGLALSFGYVFSFCNYFSGSDEIYFDSLTMVVFLILSSRFVLERFISKIVEKSSGAYIPGVIQATVIDDAGQSKVISIHDLTKEHLVVVSRGEIVSVDGRVESESAIIDNSIINGEAEPLTLERGALVFAGSRNCFGEIRVKPLKIGLKTRIGQMIESSSSLYQKGKAENLHLVAYFTAFVLLGSAVVLGYFTFIGQLGEGFRRSFSMIIIACPCAVSFGFPLIRLSMGQLALKNGILLRTPSVLAKLSKIKNVLFDKTGTLTSSVTRINKTSLDKFSTTDLFGIMALESEIDHPISRGMLRHNRFTLLPDVKDFKYLAGLGIEGRVGGDFFELLSKPREDDSQSVESSDAKFIFVYKNKKILGAIETESEIRSSAENLFKFLESKKIKVSILSGDNKEQVDKIWKSVPDSIKNLFLYEVTPEEKEQFVDQLGEDSLMVGDGMNDILAIGKAAVGVAMPGTLEEDLKVSDIALLENDLGLIEKLFQLSAKMNRTEKMLYGFTFFYNTSTVSLAIMGFIQPVVAAILMPLSSFIVLNIIFWNLGRSLWR